MFTDRHAYLCSIEHMRPSPSAPNSCSIVWFPRVLRIFTLSRALCERPTVRSLLGVKFYVSILMMIVYVFLCSVVLYCAVPAVGYVFHARTSKLRAWAWAPP